ncbi:MAG: TonB-dependent receptor [Acidobacteria bacterium]|nr:TonB-dependent receptor [Acidobacteriota bacterium]
MRSKKTICLSLSLCAVFLLFSNLGMAQSTSGTILGTVKDQSDAVVPGASITVRHLATGTVRMVTTDGQGRYRVPGLAIGQYEVSVQLIGFTTEVRTGIEITIGREALVDFSLRPGQVSEMITVTGEAPLIETTSATIASLVAPDQISELPLNGRSFAELATLQPAVAQNRSQIRYYHAGMGTKISVAGTRPEMGSFLLDGLDLSNNTGTLPTGVSGLFLGVDSVAEFQVMTNTYSAEYGTAAGGIVTVATKSGTNELHGTVFEYLRNEKLDAKNFFDLPDEPIPPFKRNQFGFSLGGPIVKDRLFFFGGYEGLRESLSVTRAVPVPTLEARAGNLPSGPITVHNAVKPFLELFAPPTPVTSGGKDFEDGRGLLLFAKSQPTRQDNFVVKVDYNASDTHSMFVRYTFDDSDSDLVDYPGDQDTALPNFSARLQFRNTYTTVEDMKMFSPTLFNVFRLGFNRTRPLSNFVQLFTPREEQIVVKNPVARDVDGNRCVPNLFVREALGQIGSRQSLPRNEILNLWHVADTLSVAKGSHYVRIGGEVRRQAFNTNRGGASCGGGQFTFNTLKDLLEGTPRQVTIISPGSETTSYPRRTLFAFFVQDDWQVRTGLTLNMGLRYEPSTIPIEKYERVASLPLDPLKVQTVEDLIYGNPQQENRSLKNFAPRFGLAWDVFGDGKTSLRSGFGISYGLTPTMQESRSLLGAPFSTSTLYFPNPPFPDPTAGQIRAGAISAGGNPRGLKNTYVMSWSLEIQRQITESIVTSVGYLGNHGVNIPGFMPDWTNRPTPILRADGSFFYPAGAPTQNSRLSAGASQNQNNLTSFYNGLVASLRKRMAGGLQYQVAYTWSKALDMDSGPGGIQYQNNEHIPEWRRPDLNWGPADFDIRQNFTSNLSYEWPFSTEGLLGHFIEGWSTNFILSLSSGHPLALKNGFARSRNGETNATFGERPNLKPGFTHKDIVQGGPDQYYDPNVFKLQDIGTYGNLGRHVAEGPGYATFDFSAFKRFPIAEGKSLQFRAEFFNLFNHPNFQIPDPFIFFDATEVPSKTAGRVASTTSSSRQIQFGLKLTF